MYGIFSLLGDAAAALVVVVYTVLREDGDFLVVLGALMNLLR